jgi:hypothetical protein
MIIIGIHVDDCLIMGKEKSSEILIDELKKIKRNVNEYLSYCIDESKDERKLTMI